MKTTRTLLLISIALLALLLFRTCNEKPCQLNSEEAIQAFKKSRHIIGIDTVKSLYKNYKDRFVPKIKEIQEDPENGITRENYLPTEYSLIPLQKLKDYIAFLDALQEKNPSQMVSGIAINFGAYDFNPKRNYERKKSNKSNLENPLSEGDCRGRLTTFFTPTYYSGNVNDNMYDAQNHIPFYIDYDDETDKFKGTFRSIYNAPWYNTSQSNQASSVPNFLINALTPIAAENVQSASMNEFTNMPPKKN